MENNECIIKKINRCIACDSKNLIPVISLGKQYVSNYVEHDFDYNNEKKVPLELVICNTESGCGLLQLNHIASRDYIYSHYWFRSGLNETMKDALSDITKSIENMIQLEKDDLVLDIGCNDGTLLRTYSSKVFRVGFEPATNLVNEAKIDTNKIINNFFTAVNFKNEFGERKCKVITSIAMFYDLENPDLFVSDIDKILDETGVWVIQMAYLIPMLELNGFDNIGHEHIEYYSFFALKKLLEKHNFTIFHIEINDVYGGSVRAYVKKKSNNKLKILESIKEIENLEIEKNLNQINVYNEFADRVKEIKKSLLSFITNEVNNGKKIYVYGASTKGNTLLQYCELDSKLISKAVDRDPIKYNKKTIGSNIPIISEEDGRKEHPDYFLILPWHLTDYFKIREKEYLEKGGKFIVPIPKVRVIDKNGEKFL